MQKRRRGREGETESIQNNIINALNRLECLLPVAKSIRHRILFCVIDDIRYQFEAISKYVSVLCNCILVQLFSGTDGNFHVLAKFVRLLHDY